MDHVVSCPDLNSRLRSGNETIVRVMAGCPPARVSLFALAVGLLLPLSHAAKPNIVILFADDVSCLNNMNIGRAAAGPAGPVPAPLLKPCLHYTTLRFTTRFKTAV